MIELNVVIPKKDEYSYPILIGEGLISRASEYIKKYSGAKKFLVVTNETIFEKVAVKPQLEGAQWLILKDGEEYKDFISLQKILDKALELKLERKDAIVAFGGGVIGDMAGFAASIYQRGIDFIQIPTTLLSQVDSSVGGKVAINHSMGKNMIGSFYQPKVVLIDAKTLKTLPLRQIKTGLGEILKYAFIEKSCTDSDFELYDFLINNKDDIFELKEDVIAELIKICCLLKAAVVNQDEKEQGIRVILNLGHTFAHAIENVTEYKTYTHGEAVAIGLKMAFNLALEENLIDEKYYLKAQRLLDLYDITPQLEQNISADKIFNAMFLDKKVQNSSIRFVLPVSEGRVDIFDSISSDSVKNAILQAL